MVCVLAKSFPHFPGQAVNHQGSLPPPVDAFVLIFILLLIIQLLAHCLAQTAGHAPAPFYRPQALDALGNAKQINKGQLKGGGAYAIVAAIFPGSFRLAFLFISQLFPPFVVSGSRREKA